MFGFKSKETLKKEIREELAAEAEEKAREEARRVAEAEEKARLEEEQRMKNSDEPWVEIRGIVEDKEKGIKIELDWNDAFVKYLRKNGYTGVDDDAVIQRYIAVLSKQVADDMADEQVNENE